MIVRLYASANKRPLTSDRVPETEDPVNPPVAVVKFPHGIPSALRSRGRPSAVLSAVDIAEVIPAVQVDGRVIGDGRPGPITRQLIAAFHEHTRMSGVPIA